MSNTPKLTDAAEGDSCPPTCSLIGDELPSEITETMEDCSTCGSRPKDLFGVAHPRIVKVSAMGAAWKCNCVCMVCGYFVVGKTVEEAVQAWNEHHAPSGYYQLPEDCSDLNTENVKGMAGISGPDSESTNPADR